MKTPNKKKGGSRKHGRNKRPVDQLTSFYVRDVITFEQYAKGKNIKLPK